MKQNLRERLEKLCSDHDEDHVGCTECAARFKLTELQHMFIEEDPKSRLDADGRELWSYIEMAQWRRYKIVQGAQHVPFERRDKMLKDFDEGVRSAQEELNLLIAEASVGLIVFDDVHEHQVRCPACGEGTLELALEQCDWCDGHHPRMDMRQLTVFNDPWDDAGEDIWVCDVPHDGNDGQTCAEQRVDPGAYDFNYIRCCECERLVIERCPSNGWHEYFRRTEDGEEICLRCYEEGLLENGVSDDSLEDGKIPGMFLNGSDLEDAGYECVDDYVFISTEKSARDLCDRAMELKKRGCTIIFSWERMAIGGIEGSVSFWKREPDALAANGD